MNPAVIDTLEAINSRFPVGAHASKIKQMLEEKLPFDYEEVRRGLEDIKVSGGSEGIYVNESDKEDCVFYLCELEEARSF
ncbi:MAG: hypothetical protein HOP31_07360, partial [Ignavibacteria bacterium]|nr:hypothetical protein [Ignavibacteria bacterium]